MAAPRRYAEGTTVATEKTRAEIERTLTRYGATAFAVGIVPGRAVIQFEAHGRHVRFELTLPTDPNAEEFRTTRGGVWRDQRGREKALDDEVKRLWRALGMAIKAKLEVVESGIATFEEEFLAHVVIPGGGTVGGWLQPQLQHAYETGEPIALLPGGSPQLPSGR